MHLSNARKTGTKRNEPAWQKLKLRWAEITHLAGLKSASSRHARQLCDMLASQPASTLHVRALLQCTLSMKWNIEAADKNLARIAQARAIAQSVGDQELLCECIERQGVYLHTMGS